MYAVAFIFLALGWICNAQQTCYRSYPDYEIDGNDLVGVPSTKSSSCCSLCQQNAYCVAYTWEPYEGGMCWLKNDTFPLAKALISGTSSGFVSPGPKQMYSLAKEYAGESFFDDFWVDSRSSQVYGFAIPADNQTAWGNGLLAMQDGKAYIGVDHTSTISNSSWGRLSVRINTKQLFNAGLFIISLDHVPTGPYANGSGWHSSPVWPDIRLSGDNSSNGQFDIYEAWNPSTVACNGLTDLDENLYGKCSLPWDPKKYANISNWNYNGLLQESPEGLSDDAFNSEGGGVYAAQWVHGQFFKVWYFHKTNLPDDIANESPNPNPGTWGIPNGYYVFGDLCNPEVVNNVYLSILTSFCNPPVTDECQAIVRTNPSNFESTYFLINYIKVFCRPGENCVSGTYGS